MPSSSRILESFLDSDQGLQADHLLQFNKANDGRDFLSTLNYYQSFIGYPNGSMIAYEYLLPYMSSERKEKLLWNLQIANLLLTAQEQYEQNVHKNRENAQTYQVYKQRCLELIRLLSTDYLQFVRDQNQLILEHLQGEELLIRKKQLILAYQFFLDQETHQEERKKCKQLLDFLNRREKNQNLRPEEGQCSDGMPVKYLGAKLAQLKTVKTGDIIKQLNAINDKRLYWVWGGGFVKLLLDETLVPDFFDCNARDTAHFLDPYTGCMSFALYFYRLFLHFRVFLNDVRHPRSEEEKAMTWKERSHWLRVKYPILNDLLWGWANFFYFFWPDMKVGQEDYLNKVAAGDLLTTILLVFDAGMAILEYTEQKALFDDNIKEFNIDIDKLKQKMDSAKSKEEKNAYQRRKENVEGEKEQCIRDFHLQKTSLVINVIYAIGLFLAYSLVAFGGPWSAVVLAGTILCFAFTVINNAMKNGMEVYKTSLSLQDLKKACQVKINAFNHPDTPLYEKKCLFLELKALKAETEYQKVVVSCQTMQFFRSLLLEAFLVPMSIFLPFGISIYPGIFAVVGISNAMVNDMFKEEKSPLTPFSQEEYGEFSKNPEAWLKNPGILTSSNFFSSSKSEKIDAFEFEILQHA